MINDDDVMINDDDVMMIRRCIYTVIHIGEGKDDDDDVVVWNDNDDVMINDDDVMMMSDW